MTDAPGLNDALARHQAGDLAGALAIYAALLQREPGNVDAWHLGGMAHFGLGRADIAVAWISQSIRINPAFAAAHNNLGNVMRALGDLGGAHAAYLEAARLDPGMAEVHLNLGIIEREQGHVEAAEARFLKALALRPGFAQAHYSLGNSLQARREFRAAEANYRAAIAAVPGFFEPYNNLGNVLVELGLRREAGEVFRQALALNPNSADVLHNMANLAFFSGDVPEAKRLFRDAMVHAPDTPSIMSSYLFALGFDEDTSAPQLLAEHLEYNRRFIVPLRSERPARYAQVERLGRDPARKLRIAYVSRDFRMHPVGHFLLPVIRHHDRQAFEVFCYSTGAGEDSRRQDFRRLADRFIDADRLNDQDLAAQILADEIDILIDCAGHLEGARLQMFGRAPAPVQVSFPVYPATTGVETIGWRIMDPYFGPPEADAWHSERLVRLPDAHICYEPVPGAPDPVTRPPCLDRGYVTFGSFNNLAKLGPQTVAAFARIVLAVPGSRLQLKWHGIEETDVVSRRFRDAGLDSDRIDILGWSDSPYTPYLGLDIALDPLLANGGTTTCDALYMGVPVVSCAGDRPFARVGLCHLTNIGLPELVAPDPESFVALAINLAGDKARMEGLRQGLRQRLLASPLADQRRYVANLDQAYRQMWRQWCGQTG